MLFTAGRDAFALWILSIRQMYKCELEVKFFCAVMLY